MIGSPPPAGSKKVVPKLRSVSSMVRAPARTGTESSSKNAVTSIDHTNSGILCRVMPGARMLKIVVMKLIEPSSELTPAMCSEKITMSKAGPLCPDVDKGGYITQPPPKPSSPPAPGTNIELNSSRKEKGSSQNEMLFIRGKAMSGAPIISGTNQLPKPPIMAGMTMKKIMIRPCMVVMTL